MVEIRDFALAVYLQSTALLEHRAHGLFPSHFSLRRAQLLQALETLSTMRVDKPPVVQWIEMWRRRVSLVRDEAEYEQSGTWHNTITIVHDST